MRFLLLLVVLAAGCASNPKPIRYERVGPVIAEVWQKKDKSCERRVYLDSMYFVTVVPCEVK